MLFALFSWVGAGAGVDACASASAAWDLLHLIRNVPDMYVSDVSDVMDDGWVIAGFLAALLPCCYHHGRVRSGAASPHPIASHRIVAPATGRTAFKQAASVVAMVLPACDWWKNDARHTGCST